MEMMNSASESLARMETSRYTRLFVKALLLALAALMIYLPYLIRPKSLFLSGGESYYHLSNGTINKILNFLAGIFSTDARLLAIALPFAAGLISVLALMALLKKAGLEYNLIVLSALIFIFSPSFLFLFSTLNSYAFAVLIILISAYMMLSGRWIISALLLYLLPFFGTFPLVAALVLLAIYNLREKSYKSLLMALPALFILFPAGQETLPSYGSLISELGGRYGLSLFIILMSFFGLKTLWQDKYKHIWLYMSIIALSALSLFDIRILSILSIPIAVLASIGLFGEIKMEWQSNPIKFLTIMTLICGIVFSAFAYASFLARDMPNSEIFDAMAKLRELPPGNILSGNTELFWIKSLAKGYVYDKSLFYTRDRDEAKNLINTKGIKYIWIDKNMEYSMWEDDEEGLLYLLKYGTGDFHIVYANSYVRIYEVGAL